MKTPLAFALLLALSLQLAAQEPVPSEKARGIARKILASLGSVEDAPFHVEADAEKAQAFAHEPVGVLVMPDKALSAAALGEAGQDAVPIGQLWLLKAVVAAGDGKPAAKERLRTVVVEDGDRERDVQLYLLGAKKNAAGNLELLAFGKGQEPLLRVPLEKTSHASEPLPLHLTGRKVSENSGVLSVHILGQHKADVTLVRPAE
jgi:hypothetical protein